MKLLRYAIYIALLLVACQSPAAAPQLPTPAAAASAPDYVQAISQEICDAFAELLDQNSNSKLPERCVSYKLLEPFHTAGADGYFLLTTHVQGQFGFVLFFKDGELVAMFPE